ncbi:DUF7507 domain-containing protein, partial [Sphingobacterium olei]
MNFFHTLARGMRQANWVLYLGVLLFTLIGANAFADGSRDLYPTGATGLRAYLRAHTAPTVNWPFANHGTHYVYAKVGETITVASSAQGGGSGRIRLYAPSGVEVVNSTSAGQISDRTAELAGPQLLGQTGGNRYTPIYHNVTTEGVYRVEFVARATNDPTNTYVATANWTQSSVNAGILAWDVSVINSTNSGFIKGRVYTNVLNLTNGTGSANTNGFYGLVYVLTKDGYTYRVDNNGNNGLYFTFFVNNNGFVDNTTQEPIYKSLNTTSNLGGRVHDPNAADTERHITHKMFYTLPAGDLPASATGAVPDGSTWLKNAVVTPEVSGVQLVGADNTPGQVSNKGGFVQFNAGTQGNYTIIIESTAVPAAFVTRTLTGSASAGSNSVLWDGKDGVGASLPAGNVPAEITVQLQGAEVHFPFFDMEYNRFGTIVELLDHTNLTNVVSDIVYWNDQDVPDSGNGSNPNPKNNSHLPPANSIGISSKTNGHIWGVGGSGASGQFGDVKSIDTWTFIKGEAVTIATDVSVKIADLEISSITPNKTSIALGDELTYTVKVKNDGPSDVEGAPFTFKAPDGFSPLEANFISACGATQAIPITYDPITNTYSSSLNIPNGCEVTYTIKGSINETVLSGELNVEASILRPNDVTDPDATNQSDPSGAGYIPPTDPHFECSDNGLGGGCNNILTNRIDFVVGNICTEQIDGENFSWSYGSNQAPSNPIVSEFSQPGTSYGFVLDIYELDNSFNMSINGQPLATSEIEFQSNGTPAPGINVRFADGDLYETNTEGAIWQMAGSSTNPLIRVVISPTGNVSMFGSKTSGGPLFPLELFNGNSLNTINWSPAGNTLQVRQNVVGATLMSGRGYGLNVVPCIPSMELLKSGDYIDTNDDDVVNVGDQIDYTFTLANTGNVAIENVVLNDPLFIAPNPVVVPVLISGDANNNNSLDPGETWTFEAKYAITQDNIDAGGIWNLATASGETPGGDPASDESEDPNPLDPNNPNFDPQCPTCTFTELVQTPSFTVTKEITSAGPYNTVGQQITYDIVVTNTGNVTIDNLVLTDNNAVIPAGEENIGTLAPAGTRTISVTHVVTQADLDAGMVSNQATVSGDGPDGDPLTPVDSDDPNTPEPNDPTDTDVVQTPSFTVTKEITSAGPYNTVGQQITYDIVVTNNGNVTIDNLILTDDNAVIPAGEENIGTLAPAATATISVTHVVTQADLDAGSVSNQATVTGDGPDGDP